MPAQMLLPHEQITNELQSAIAQANNLLQEEVDSVRILRDGYESWNRRNELFLDAAFKTEGFFGTGPKTDYADFMSLNYPLGVPTKDEELSVEALRADILMKKQRLGDILKNLDLYPAATPPAETASESLSKRVFVIHGRDEISRLRVVDVIRRATDAEPVVLMEQSNQGQTIIEKLEEHLGKASGFAVVLLTGDDEGFLKGEALRPRARQNVILELGFAMAALGRRNVTLLHDPHVELPSDIQGVAYYPIDNSDWQLRLLGDLKSAGFEVHHDKL